MTTHTDQTPPFATEPTPSRAVLHPDPDTILRAIRRRSVATLATMSLAPRPHAATVLYQLVDDALYVSTMRGSRKARNVAGCPDVGVTIPIRRLPVGPPASVHFQSVATILGHDDPRIVELAGAGRLDKVTAHGELEVADGCFLRIALPARIVTYGLGLSLRRLISQPLDAAGEVVLARPA